MSDSEGLKILTAGSEEEWNEFKKTQSDAVDFSFDRIADSTLNNYDLSSCNFSDAYFDDCLLEGTTFNYANLRGATFRKCILSRAKFHRATLSEVIFDRCEVDGTDFSGSFGLTTEALVQSYGDASTELPHDVDPPDDWYMDDLPDDELVDYRYPPQVPNRVPAPIETVWNGERLELLEVENQNDLSPEVENSIINSLKENIENLVEVLSNTNFDQRIVQELRRNLEIFPSCPSDFRKQIFSLWFSFGPAFEYRKLTKGQHSDYVEARVISFEMNLRDTLRTYPEWREYEISTQAIRITDQFDKSRFLVCQSEFASNLSKIPAVVSHKIPVGLEEIARF